MKVFRAKATRPSRGVTRTSSGAIQFYGLPNLVASGQSNQEGQDSTSTGWPGAAAGVNFYDLNPENTDPPGIVTTLAVRPSGMFGCELNLANGLANAFGNVSYTKAAASGTEIAQWVPGTGLFTTLTNAIAHAKAQTGGNKIAFSWWQGETDALLQHTQAYYFAQLNVLFAALRAFAGPTTRIRFFVVQLNKSWADPTSSAFIGPYFTPINLAQQQYVASDPDSELINLDNFVPNTGVPGNFIHYGQGEQLLIGTQMVSAYARYYLSK